MPRTLADLIHEADTRHLPPGSFTLDAAVHGLRVGRGATADAKRKDRARVSLRAFCDTYLKHHFTLPYGEHHADLFRVIDAPGESKRVARIEPRHFGKTTVISLALALKALAYHEKRFILLVGESGTTAQSNLASLVDEIENNERLGKDFPHLTPQRDAKGQVVKWTDDQIVIKSGATIMAKGMGARMRGLKKGNVRPDLGILDDPESPETATSFLTRARHKRWFGGTFLGLGTKDWDVYVIGNLPHHDCLLADLVKSSKWDGKLYRAVNIPHREDERYPIGNLKQDGSPLWPEVWPAERLASYKADPTVGELGFAREMLNDPRDDKDKPFDPSQFEYFDWNESRFREYRRTAMFLDPAGGEKPNEIKKGRRDWSCLVAGGQTRDGHIEIFHVIMTKRLPDGQVEDLLTLYDHYRVRTIGVEENMLKNMIGPTINRRARERGLYPAIREIHQTKNKVQRILKRQPLFANKTVRFARHLLDTNPDFFGQFDDFPGDHDDGPDATEGLITVFENARVVGAPTGIGSASFWRRES